MSLSTLKNKDLCNKFFHYNVEDGKYQCACCDATVSAKKGYSNLMSHLKHHHADKLNEVLEKHANASGKQCMENFVVMNPAADNMFRMIEAIVMLGLPLSMVNNELFRSICKLDPTSVPTLLKNMRRLYHGVVDRIKAKLPDAFGLEFDAAKLGPTLNAVALFAVFTDPDSGSPEKLLIGFNSLIDNSSGTALNYIETFEAIVRCLGKSIENVVFTVSDNCPTNILIANTLGVPMFGCKSHLWNSAMKGYSHDHKELIQDIKEIMLFLNSSPRIRNNLSSYTKINPSVFDDQRWWSLPSMLKAFKKLLPVLDAHAVDIGGHLLGLKMLSPKQRLQFAEEEPAYKYLDQVTDRLQKPDITRGEVAVIFEAVLAKFPDRECFTKYLSNYGSSVPYPMHNTAVSKVLMGAEQTLTPEELKALDCLEGLTPKEKECKKRKRADDEDYDVNADFITAALKRHKISQTAANIQKKFAGLACIPATSNDCERLFSQVKWGFNERRKRMNSETLEMLTMLKYHRRFWNIESIMPKDKTAPAEQIEKELEEEIFIVE